MTMRHHDDSAFFHADPQRDYRADTEVSERFYSDLLHLNRSKFTQGRYIIAYHALATALDYTAELGDAQRMQEVLIVAREQAEWLAAHASSLAPSRQPMAEESVLTLWQMLIEKANVKLRLITFAYSSAGEEGRAAAS